MFIPSKGSAKIFLASLEPRKHDGRWQLFGSESLANFDSVIAHARQESDQTLGHVCLLVIPFQFDLSPSLYAAPVPQAPKLGIPEIEGCGVDADGGSIVAIARRSDSKSGGTYLTAFQSLDLYDQTMDRLRKTVGELGTVNIVVEQWPYKDPSAKGILYQIVFGSALSS